MEDPDAEKIDSLLCKPVDIGVVENPDIGRVLIEEDPLLTKFDDVDTTEDPDTEGLDSLPCKLEIVKLMEDPDAERIDPLLCKLEDVELMEVPEAERIVLLLCKLEDIELMEDLDVTSVAIEEESSLCGSDAVVEVVKDPDVGSIVTEENPPGDERAVEDADDDDTMLGWERDEEVWLAEEALGDWVLEEIDIGCERVVVLPELLLTDEIPLCIADRDINESVSVELDNVFNESERLDDDLRLVLAYA
ncbi:hypothetical protein P7C71_g1142, partial [Lecanoromycetidae sp. Uapishka_2]